MMAEKSAESDVYYSVALKLAHSFEKMNIPQPPLGAFTWMLRQRCPTEKELLDMCDEYFQAIEQIDASLDAGVSVDNAFLYALALHSGTVH